MDKKNFSMPIDLKQVTVTDAFWHREQGGDSVSVGGIE